jgi:hypothetical protein
MSQAPPNRRLTSPWAASKIKAPRRLLPCLPRFGMAYLPARFSPPRSFAYLSTLFFSWALSALAGAPPESKVDHPSPDGKLAIRIQRSPEVVMALAAIELVTQPEGELVARLAGPDDNIEEIAAAWSPDSQRLALYRGMTSGGSTELWQREKSGKFKVLELPIIELPISAEMEKPGNEWINDYVKPLTWEAPDRLLLSSTGRLCYEMGSDKERTVDYEYQTTIHLDAQGKATIGEIKKVSKEPRPSY